MRRHSAAVLAFAAALAITTASGTARAESISLGGWIGPRFFADDSALGYIDTAPEHPTLTNGMVIGFRIARPIIPWIVPELELPLSITTTDRLDVTVFWFEPRAHLRFEFLPNNKRVQPFLLLGGGASLLASTKKNIFANDAVGDGYFGIGAHAITGRGFQIRADFRIAVIPGVEKRAVLEFEAGVGLWVALGKSDKRYVRRDPDAPAKPDLDPDRDGVLADEDKCPDRAEDEDGFDDRDGCPDIDNDLDHVLDIADKCATVTESFNGFEDDDGCPDYVPDDLGQIDGTIEGLVYDPGETSLNSAARKTLKKIGALLLKYPSVKVKLTGHTDDREAKPDGKPPEGEEPPDPAQLALELSVERAAVIKAVLVGMGIGEGRVEVAGKGAEDGVGDNDSKRGRAANRRVVLTRYVPPQ
jgi:OOP family OmpA-OmpF porin